MRLFTHEGLMVVLGRAYCLPTTGISSESYFNDVIINGFSFSIQSKLSMKFIYSWGDVGGAEVGLTRFYKLPRRGARQTMNQRLWERATGFGS